MQHVSTIIGLSTIAIEKVLDFLPYPFLVSEWRDGHQRNLYVNKAFIDEIGFSCLDIPTITDWFELAYPEISYRHEVMLEWEQTRLRAIEQGKEAIVVKAKIATRCKGPQWYEVKASLSGKLDLVAFVNINAEIIKEIKLEQLNEDKNRILSVLSHDLRAPLSSLHALISLSNDGVLSQSEFNACVNKIGASTLNLMEFLDTTLQWTRANFEGIHPTIVSVHLPDMIKKICALYEKSYQDKNIAINLILLIQHLDTDPEILSIVLRNVLSNAIKFTVGGNIEISSFVNHDGVPIISVRDSGTGISESQVSSILKGISRSTDGTHQEKGFGLGLRLCTDLLRKIGGVLKIEGAVNKGTTVEIILPR